MTDINKVLEWVATVITIIAAIATALSYDPVNIYLFNLGSIIWLIWAVRIKKPSLIVVNVSLLLVYAIGILIRL